MTRPLAIVLESTVDKDCPQVEIDELRENSLEIAAALSAIGFATDVIPFSLDVAGIGQQLARRVPSVVFNLVDSIDGKGNLISMAPMLLAHMQIPFTGANALATTTTCDKLLTKHILQAHGIRAPESLTELQMTTWTSELATPYILKSITEHASFGMFADSVVTSRKEMKTRLLEKKEKYGSEWFAEEYIAGREFNLSVLGGANPHVLPPAEILFTQDFPEGKPKIVDYAAKWYEDSSEYKGTVRRFDFPASDEALLGQLTKIAAECFQVFGLTGYARVDFRVDAKGVPYVLEVNSNPFLSAGEGFGAAAARAGISFNEAIRAIVLDAYRSASAPIPQAIAA